MRINPLVFRWAGRLGSIFLCAFFQQLLLFGESALHPLTLSTIDAPMVHTLLFLFAAASIVSAVNTAIKISDRSESTVY